MNESLIRLKAIHYPSAVSVWPLAKGWYLLIAAILLLIGLGAWSYFWYRSKYWAKRLAIKQFKKIRQQYQLGSQSKQETLEALSQLLKQLLLSYHPREAIASLQGEALLAFLGQEEQWVSALYHGLYAGNINGAQMASIMRGFYSWLYRGRYV